MVMELIDTPWHYCWYRLSISMKSIWQNVAEDTPARLVVRVS